MVAISEPEWLVVDGEACATRCFYPEDLYPLLAENDRSDNEPLPYVDGTVPSFGWLDEVDVTLSWHVKGYWDPDGDPLDDPAEGLDLNLEHYRALFRDDVDADGTKPISLVTAAFTRTGTMQCRRWVPVRHSPETATVVTRLIIPAGRLPITAS